MLVCVCVYYSVNCLCILHVQYSTIFTLIFEYYRKSFPIIEAQKAIGQNRHVLATLFPPFLQTFSTHVLRVQLWMRIFIGKLYMFASVQKFIGNFWPFCEAFCKRWNVPAYIVIIWWYVERFLKDLARTNLIVFGYYFWVL